MDYLCVTRGGGACGYKTIVLAPSSVQEVHDLMQLAFHLSDKYRNPAVVLSDGVVALFSETLELKTLDFGPLGLVSSRDEFSFEVPFLVDGSPWRFRVDWVPGGKHAAEAFALQLYHGPDFKETVWDHVSRLHYHFVNEYRRDYTHAVIRTSYTDDLGEARAVVAYSLMASAVIDTRREFDLALKKRELLKARRESAEALAIGLRDQETWIKASMNSLKSLPFL